MAAGMEKQKEAEQDEHSDVVDGVVGRATKAPVSHRRAAEKQKYHTLGYQKKKQRLPVDFSTVSKGVYTNTKSRGALIQVLFNQGSLEKSPMQEERGSAGGSHSQVELLKQILQLFSMPAELRWRWGEGKTAGILEKSWTDIVHSHESMSRTQKHQQEALWELLHTELIYINQLTIITDVVLAALEHVHQRGFLQEVTSAQLFSNLPSILDAHRHFWKEVMCPMLQNVRLTGQPFDPLNLEPGCLQFADRFSAYLDYCWGEESNVDFTRRQMETNPHFNTFLMWVETHPNCGRMRLGDMQAKPHQRITKYPLLLKAILKTTQDLHTQRTLNCMLNSVSQFLDSINDYLLFKDDELALLAFSQKIEGYELQGMSEEIDKHMQEFCRFDLTSPIRGTGPKVIRKLILGETLKVRGRKDSKLEVVVLLFTDVLLLTKAQKKSEKQKVVRPPLSLEKIHCAELKDSYSFVLVEMSDLGCAVSVYSVSTPSPESCTAWISAIHQAQETLETLRKKEIIKPEEPSNQIQLEKSETFSSASIQTSKDKEEQSEFESTIAPLRLTNNQLESGKFRQVAKMERNLHSQQIHAHLLSKQIQNNRKEFNSETTQQTEETGHLNESDVLYGQTIERRVTWNHKQSQTTSNAILLKDSLETSKSNAAHRLLVGGFMENGALSQSSSGQFLLANRFVPKSAISNTQQQSNKPDLWQNSFSRQSGEENESLTESRTFTRTLKSPRIRRKRAINSQPSTPHQGSRKMSGEAESLTSMPNRNSSSTSYSEENHNLRRPSNSSSKSQDSHLVLKLGSVQQNRREFWSVPTGRLSPDPQTLSDLELPREKHDRNSQKILKIKSQRSDSIHELQPSRLHGLLKRANERERDRGIAKREGKPFGKIVYSFQSPISVCATPSPSSSEGEQEAVGEELELFSPRLRYYSHTGTETSMNSSDNERKNRHGTPLGVNVDWPDWCFDDEDVQELSGLDDETVDWFEQTPITTELQQVPRHDNGEYSEV